MPVARAGADSDGRSSADPRQHRRRLRPRRCANGKSGAGGPDLRAFRHLAAQWPSFGGRLSLFLYASTGEDVRTRMFAPLAGTWEDPATGSANATLAAPRLHLSGGESLGYGSIQGVEMGRESQLAVRAWRAEDGVRASVGGACVDMFHGSITL